MEGSAGSLFKDPSFWKTEAMITSGRGQGFSTPPWGSWTACISPCPSMEQDSRSTYPQDRDSGFSRLLDSKLKPWLPPHGPKLTHGKSSAMQGAQRQITPSNRATLRLHTCKLCTYVSENLFLFPQPASGEELLWLTHPSNLHTRPGLRALRS